MDAARINQLLEPYLHGDSASATAELSSRQHAQISTYIDLLIRWNARVNLTAIRTPQEIITRHFGESFFAARHLLPASPGSTGAGAAAGVSPFGSAPANSPLPATGFLVDFGSGAGFPGLPMKIWAPHTHVMLIESNNKKVAFLREVIRALTLIDVNVFQGRAEDFPPASAALLTLRAVERFDAALATAARLVAPAGRLALLIGQSQVVRARSLVPEFSWSPPIAVPGSEARVLLRGQK